MLLLLAGGVMVVGCGGNGPEPKPRAATLQDQALPALRAHAGITTDLGDLAERANSEPGNLEMAQRSLRAPSPGAREEGRRRVVGQGRIGTAAPHAVETAGPFRGTRQR
jgi:hypothetical protein